MGCLSFSRTLLLDTQEWYVWGKTRKHLFLENPALCGSDNSGNAVTSATLTNHSEELLCILQCQSNAFDQSLCTAHPSFLWGLAQSDTHLLPSAQASGVSHLTLLKEAGTGKTLRSPQARYRRKKKAESACKTSRFSDGVKAEAEAVLLEACLPAQQPFLDDCSLYWWHFVPVMSPTSSSPFCLQ